MLEIWGNIISRQREGWRCYFHPVTANYDLAIKRWEVEEQGKKSDEVFFISCWEPATPISLRGENPKIQIRKPSLLFKKKFKCQGASTKSPGDKRLSTCFSIMVAVREWLNFIKIDSNTFVSLADQESGDEAEGNCTQSDHTGNHLPKHLLIG